jgi:hypothetical protein
LYKKLKESGIQALYTKKSGQFPLFNEAFLATTPWDSHSSTEILTTQGQKFFSIRHAGSLTKRRRPLSSRYDQMPGSGATT